MSDNALHTAAEQGNLELVQIHVQNFDINAKGKNDETALFKAADRVKTDTVKLLLSFNPDVNIPNLKGQTALWLACVSGNTDIALVLLQAPTIDINHAADENTTALIMSCSQGHTDIALALIAAPGINVNHAMSNGWTALTFSCALGHANITLALLECPSIDVDHTDNDGFKAIDVAKNEEIKDLLRNALSIQAEAVRKRQPGTGEEASRRKKEADEVIRKQSEVEESAVVALQQQKMEAEDTAHRAKEADEALIQAATSNFTGLTADQVGDLLVKSLGEQYTLFKDSIVQMGLTGALVAQSIDDNDLSDVLKEVGVTGKLQLKAIEMKFKTFYQSNVSAVVSPSAAPAVIITPAVMTVSVTVPASEVPGSNVGSKVDSKHIMMSYCWANDANPAHVKALADYLRSKYGYDVWQDTDGSTICGKMEDGTDDKIADAVDKSAFVIICVSKAYPTRPNCEQEAKFAKQKEKAKRLKIIYVMMQSDYTTVSEPDYVEGWLAMYIGDKLWYPLWDIKQVASTGDSIAGLIGDHAKVSGIATGAGIRGARQLAMG